MMGTDRRGGAWSPVTTIALTHGHNDHINAAVDLQSEVDAPILLHPADRVLWSRTGGGLLTLPLATLVHAGHGEPTMIGREALHLDEWLRRGH